MRFELRAAAPFVLSFALAGCRGYVQDLPTRPGDRPRGGDAAPQCVPGESDPGPTVLRRLTHEEYAATIRAELGVDVSDLVATLPPDPRAEGFTNNASTLIVPLELAEGYLEVAESAVGRADVGALAARYVSCADLSSACAEETVRAFGRRLLRAEPDDAQVARYTPIFGTVRDEGGDYETAVGLVMTAMLIAPQMLYRIEEEPTGDEVVNVPARDLAARLSFFVVGAAPDDALLDAADRGDLDHPEGIEREARRLLDDPRARARSMRFFEDWLGLAPVPELVLPDDRYPAHDSALAAQMREETLRFLDDLAWESRAPLIEMYTAEHTFLTPRLAEIYGLEPRGEGWQRYDLSSLPERRGLLTQPALLAAHAHGPEPSIVSRGLFVLEHVLCDHVPPPPPSVDATPPVPAPGASQRDASDARIGNASCGSCHARFDPFGHAFDPFDALGAFRREDPAGNPLQHASSFLTVDGQQIPFEDVDGFTTILADSPRAQACIVRKATQFARGRPLAPADRCTVDEIRADFEARGGRYEDLVLAIVTHPSFGRIAPAGPEVAP
jgi:hypothetical protein